MLEDPRSVGGDVGVGSRFERLGQVAIGGKRSVWETSVSDLAMTGKLGSMSLLTILLNLCEASPKKIQPMPLQL